MLRQHGGRSDGRHRLYIRLLPVCSICDRRDCWMDKWEAVVSMTKDEVIKIIEDACWWYWQGHCHGLTQAEIFGARDMAIQALSQEPICDRDCEHCTWTECPIEPCDDAISRKSGHWICIDDYHHIGKFKCSVCQIEGFPNTVMNKPTWNYCPNCGAKMESEG